MTPTDRLDHLILIANRDPLTEAEVRRRLFRFLHGFKTQGLRLGAGERELWDVRHATAKELAATTRKIEMLFDVVWMFERPSHPSAGNIGPDDVGAPLSFPSLRFAAFWGQPGFIVTAGRLRDLVPYLAMWLLSTEPVVVKQCQAPAFRDWQATCGRLFVQGAMGRPRKVCGEKCAARVKAVRVNEQMRESMEAKKGKRRKR